MIVPKGELRIAVNRSFNCRERAIDCGFRNNVLGFKRLHRGAQVAQLPSNHNCESDCSPDARKHVLCRFRQQVGQLRSRALRIQWPAPFCLDHFCRSNLNCWLAAV